MRAKEGLWYIYILASRRKGTLYIGSTDRLLKRVRQHKDRLYPYSFTAKYNVTMLVYYEVYGSSEALVTRERQLKKWNRQWKVELIEKMNPTWRDLYFDLIKDF